MRASGDKAADQIESEEKKNIKRTGDRRNWDLLECSTCRVSKGVAKTGIAKRRGGAKREEKSGSAGSQA